MNKIKMGMVLFYFFLFLILGIVMTVAFVYSGWLSVKPIPDAEGPWYYYQFYLIFIIAFGVGMLLFGVFFTYGISSPAVILNIGKNQRHVHSIL